MSAVTLTSRCLLVACVTLAPLMFGTASAGSTIVCLLLAIVALLTAPRARTSGARLLGILLAVPFVALLLIEGLRSQGFFLTDRAWLEPVLTGAREALLGDALVEPGRWGSPGFELSMLRAATVTAVLIAAVLHGQGQRSSSAMLRWILFTGIAAAAVTLALHMVQPDKVLWREKTAYLPSFTGSFVHRGANGTWFATFAVAALLLLLAPLASSRLDLRDGRLGFFRRTTRIVSDNLGSTVAFGACFLMLAGGVILSNSRLAFAALAGQVILALLLFWRSGRSLFSGIVTLLAGLALIGGVLTLTGAQFGRRLLREGFESEARPEIWQEAIRGIMEAPLFGHGLGSTAAFFAVRQPESVADIGDILSVHSLPLELAFEVGIPFAAFVCIGWAQLILRVAVGGLREPGIDPVAWIGVSAALTLAFLTSTDVVHGTLGAVLPVCALLGIAVGRDADQRATARYVRAPGEPSGARPAQMAAESG